MLTARKYGNLGSKHVILSIGSLAERTPQPPMLRRSSLDSPLEGDGFELVVPRHESRGGFLEHPPARDRFAPDSPLEEDGFKPSVPPSKKRPWSGGRAQPSSS